MLAGELDYSNIFGLTYEIANDTTVQNTVVYSETAYFVWVIFLILVPILLSNMLVCAANSIVACALKIYSCILTRLA